MADIVRVRGLREMNAAFGRMSKSLQRELQAELRKVAEPVASDARGKASKWGERTASGIRARTRGGAALVQQTRRKTTGQHPEFGGLQMREALVPALDEHEHEIVPRVEHMLDRLSNENGF